MINLESYLIFLGVALVAVTLPGPATLLAISNGIKHGPKRSIAAALGNISALVVMASVSALGLGAIVLASTTLFLVLKIAGGAYLVYLGIRLWFSPANASEMEYLNNGYHSVRQAWWQLYRQAFFTGMSNPKAIAFLTALFPQFLDLQVPLFHQLVVLSGTLALISFVYLVLVSSLSARFRNWFVNPKRMQKFNRFGGGVFVGMGSSLLASSR